MSLYGKRTAGCSGIGLGANVDVRVLYGVVVIVGVLEGRGVIVKAGVVVGVGVGVLVMVAVLAASLVALADPLQPVRPARIRTKSSRSNR